MIQSILKDTTITIEALKADGDNETINGAGVDMQGYSAVAFLVGILKGNIASPTIKAQQDTDSAFGTAADLAGTSVTFASTAQADGLACLGIVEPRERYVRAVIAVPNINTAEPVFCLAIRFKSIDKPGANAGELHVSPAEGTA